MTMPPAGPPPGYQGPQGPQQPQRSGYRSSQYGDPTVAMSRPGQHYAPQEQSAPPTPRAKGSGTITILGVVAVACVIVGLSIDENGHNAWESVNAWGGLAIAGAVATLAPALGRTVGLSAQRAWQVAVCGAGALVLFWVLFVLPTVGSNTSLLTTIGVAAGLIAAWLAPGRSEGADDTAHSW